LAKPSGKQQGGVFVHPIITSTFRLAVPFWRDAPQRHAAWLLALVLVALAASSTGLNAWLNHLN
jgi:hypothetical protein